MKKVLSLSAATLLGFVAAPHVHAQAILDLEFGAAAGNVQSGFQNFAPGNNGNGTATFASGNLSFAPAGVTLTTTGSLVQADNFATLGFTGTYADIYSSFIGQTGAGANSGADQQQQQVPLVLSFSGLVPNATYSLTVQQFARGVYNETNPTTFISSPTITGPSNPDTYGTSNQTGNYQSFVPSGDPSSSLGNTAAETPGTIEFTATSAGTAIVDDEPLNGPDSDALNALELSGVSGGLPVAPTIPEPSTYALLAGGLAGLLVLARRRRLTLGTALSRQPLC